jgi:Sec-independent protein translocase protein TatA
MNSSNLPIGEQMDKLLPLLEQVNNIIGSFKSNIKDKRQEVEAKDARNQDQMLTRARKEQLDELNKKLKQAENVLKDKTKSYNDADKCEKE